MNQVQVNQVQVSRVLRVVLKKVVQKVEIREKVKMIIQMAKGKVIKRKSDQ